MRKYLIAFIFLFSFFSCQNSEFIQREYPIIFSLDISEVTDTSVLANAKLLESYNGIIEHGFILGFSSDPTPIDTIFLGPLKDGQKSFQYSFDSMLFQPKRYYVVAFVKTSGYSVYGNPVSFSCQLCGPAKPSIYSFTPSETRELGSIRIKGINLMIENPQLFYGTSICTINKINESELSFSIPSQRFVTFKSRHEKIYLQTQNNFGSRVQSISSLTLQEPWLRLSEKKKLLTIYNYAFSSDNRIYFLSGRNLFHIDYDTREETYVNKLPEFYNAISCSAKYQNKWYVVFSDGIIGGMSYFWEYDILNDSWRKLPDLPTNGYYSFAFASDNTLFLIDPYYESENLKFDLNGLSWDAHLISTEIFTTTPKFIQTKNSVYALSNNQFAILNPVTETWEVIEQGIFPMDYTYVIGDVIYIGNKSKLLRFLPGNNAFQDITTLISSFPQYLIQQSVAEIDFIINMDTRGILQSGQLWEFDPSYFESQ